ncbi:MAG: hypothetical protein WDM94_08525 [Bauldia sp.]
MRIALAVVVACLTLGSWHWQPLVPLSVAETADPAAREIYTGGMTLDVRTAPFTRVRPTTSL